MKKISILLAIISLLVYGCSSNEEVYNNCHKGGDNSFRVTVEQPVFNETRAHLDGLNVVFDNEDKIAVFDKNTAKSEYTYSSSDSNTEPGFSGTSLATGDALEGVFALYPYSAASSYNSGILPDEQTYYENSFSNESQIMYGQTDHIEDGFNLNNMCGYIRLHLYGENVFVKEITLSVTGEGEYVSGDFQIETSDEGDGYALLMNSDENNQKQSVKLVCPGGVKLGTTSETATVFYIALPPQTYTQGFSVTITDKFGRNITKKASTPLELKRNHIKPMEALEVAFGADELEILADEEGNQYIEIKSDKPERLLKWAYTVNNFDNTLGFVLEGNITMPLKEIEEDPVNKTYRITDRDITVTDGVPSGSNWIPVGTYIGSSDLSKAFKGNIDGAHFTISGICINKTGATGVGLIGEFADGSIRDLTINESYIYSDGQAVGIVGDNRYNTVIENVHLKESQIQGKGIVGGIVGYNYRRRQNEGQTHERLSYIINCSTDNNTKIFGSGDYVGGICGYNQAHAIINCVNNADVTGQNLVGGIAGESRTYTKYGVNGYVIASGSTSDAEITATGNSNGANAGGIAGRNWRNKDHKPSQSYVIACYSFSTVNSTKTNHKGSLIGSGYGTIHSGLIYSSFAMKNGLNNIVAHDQNPEEIFASNHFESASDVTQDFVDEMNAAIDDYNNNVDDIQDDAIEKVKCHYKWQYNADEWPTLVPTTSSGDN